jgi:signal transduction histidine kinase
MADLWVARDAPAEHPWWAAAPRGTAYLLRVSVVVGAYYGAARVGYALDFAGPVAAIVWLPVGVAIAALYSYGLALWPGVLIGDLLANDYTALPWGTAIGQTCGNMLEVLIAAVVLRRLARSASPLATVHGVVQMLVTIAGATLVSATIGGLSLLAGGVVEVDSLVTVWRTWWLGDACGALVVVPLALAWVPRPRGLNLTPARVAEAAVMLASVAALSEVAFRSSRPLLYVVFPAFVWSALRFGQRGATAAIALGVGFTVWNVVHHGSAFHFHGITDTVLNVQLYIAVASITTLALGAVAAEREAYAVGLGRSRARMVEAADTERRRLERNLHDGAQHRLTALADLLNRAAQRVRTAPEDSVALVEQAESEVTVVIDELRELAHGIHPPVLTDLGLAKALQSLAARSVVHVDVLEVPDVRLDPVAEATGYYVVAEAVTNAQRYARASSVRVRASVHRGLLFVEVTDDGVGNARMAEGSGLQGLCDRVEAVGGTFGLRSPAGKGTQVRAVLPIRPSA